MFIFVGDTLYSNLYVRQYLQVNKTKRGILFAIVGKQNIDNYQQSRVALNH